MISARAVITGWSSGMVHLGVGYRLGPERALAHLGSEGPLAAEGYFQLSVNVTAAPVPLAADRLAPDSHVTFPAPSMTMYLY